MYAERLRGIEKAAVLAVTLPPDAARALLSRLAPRELARVLDAVARLDEVPAELGEWVVREFERALARRSLRRAGGTARARRLALDALGHAKAAPLLARLERSSGGVEALLAGLEPAFVARTLAGEHPQTLALVLAQLSAERGAAILAALPDALAAPVVEALARIRRVPTEVVAELERALAVVFVPEPEAPVELCGVELAARLLRRAPRGFGSLLLDQMGERDPALADAVRERLLRFEDLRRLARREFQLLLREVPIEELVRALQQASETLREKVYTNVSSRAAEQIREELELLGTIPRRESEAAQAHILEIARRLHDEGRIELDPEPEDDAP